MTHTDVAGDRHAETWDLLPWYANATLAEAERSRVEGHLESCEECARELSFLSGLRASITDEPPLLLSTERSLAALGERIDALEAARQGRLGWLDIARLARARLARPPAALGARAALAALVLALVVGTGWLWSDVSDPEFRTLSSASAVAATPDGALRLVFAGSATVEELQKLLNRLDVVLVAGPSTYGVYTARIMAPADAARLDQILTELREHPLVTFAEPISAAAAARGGS